MRMGFACAAALLAGACNVVPTVAVTPRYGPLSVDGDLAASSGATATASSAEALGMDEDSGVLAPRVDGSWLGFDAWASWYDARFTGTGAAEGQLDLGGVVIGADEPTETEFDILLGTSGIVYDLVPGDLIDLGLGLGVGYVDFDAQVTSLVSAQSIRAAEDFALPLVAARAALDAGDFELSLVVAGLALELDGDSLEILDGDAMLRWSFLDAGPAQGAVVVGYRVSHVAAEYDEGGSSVDADLGFDGPYAGVSVRF